MTTQPIDFYHASLYFIIHSSILYINITYICIKRIGKNNEIL